MVSSFVNSPPAYRVNVAKISSLTYFLKSPDLLPQFETEVREKGLSNWFLVATDATAYERVVKPVDGLKSIFPYVHARGCAAWRNYTPAPVLHFD
jgi:hypothetical protein